MGTDRVGLDRYEKGGYWRVDDRSGARVRAYDTREEWNGAIVDKDDWEARHPQEFLRSVRDDQSVPKPRPVPPLAFVGPAETTLATAAAAGATALTVVDSAGFTATQQIAIMLDDLNRFLTTISVVPDGTHITLATPLPFSSAVGNLVIDYAPLPVVSL